RATSAEVEYFALAAVVEKEQIDRRYVFDGNEITRLLAISIAIAAFEQLHLAGFAKLVEMMKRDGRHASLVTFALAINVEVAKPGDLRRLLWQDAAHVLIEQELRVTVHVKRRFTAAFLAEFLAAAIDRGGRRVQERNAFGLAEVQQHFRIFEIVAHHVLTVVFHGVGTGALMQHRRELLKGARLHAREEFAFVEIIGELAVD